MKAKFALALFLLNFGFAFSQDDEKIKRKFFPQFELAIPITGNQYEPEDPNERKSFVAFNGISSRVGYGLHFTTWFSLSAHSGIEFKIREKLVAAPVYANLTINPVMRDESCINLQLGYGHSFALGRGNLSGIYKRASIGIENEGILIFLEISEHRLEFGEVNRISSFSIGIAYRNY